MDYKQYRLDDKAYMEIIKKLWRRLSDRAYDYARRCESGFADKEYYMSEGISEIWWTLDRIRKEDRKVATEYFATAAFRAMYKAFAEEKMKKQAERIWEHRRRS